MSLYNQLFGVNFAAGTLLQMLGVHVRDVPRFRDCFLKGNSIVILTRTGGNNREDYREGVDRLRAVPGFLTEHDQSSDTTYAHFAYAIPPQYAQAVETLRQMGAEDDPVQKWARLLVKLKDPAMKDDPEVKQAMRVGEMISSQMQAGSDGQAPRIIEV